MSTLALSSVLLITAMQAVTQPVSRDEYRQTWDGEFAKMDANQDGQVTAEEAAAKQNRDNQMQVLAANQQIFARLDRDGNGQLSPEEFAGLAAQPPAANPAPFMQRMDLDQNGSVSMVEHRRVMLGTFDSIDTDVDGMVTPAEMDAAAQRAQQAAQQAAAQPQQR